MLENNSSKCSSTLKLKNDRGIDPCFARKLRSGLTFAFRPQVLFRVDVRGEVEEWGEIRNFVLAVILVNVLHPQTLMICQLERVSEGRDATRRIEITIDPGVENQTPMKREGHAAYETLKYACIGESLQLNTASKRRGHWLHPEDAQRHEAPD